MNLTLISTTDSDLDSIILDLDKSLIEAGIPDDKIYSNSQYFFSNMTLARFTRPINESFKNKIEKLSSALSLELLAQLPLQSDSVKNYCVS